jgi:hypothetical protein
MIAARDDRVLGPEHVLLGLVREKRGVAGQVLAVSGVTSDNLVAMIERLHTRDDGAGQG